MTRDYVSCSIIVHQLQTTAKILDSSSSAATARKTSRNNITQTTFHKSYEILINNSRLLTQNYQNEVKKWQLKQYDNDTWFQLQISTCPSFRNWSIERKLCSLGLRITPKLVTFISNYFSLKWCYRHFRNFVAASNPAEDRISTQLLSNALIYESNSFAAFNNVTGNKSDNHIW